MTTPSEATTARWKDPEMRAKMKAGLKKYFDRRMKQRLRELARGES